MRRIIEVEEEIRELDKKRRNLFKKLKRAIRGSFLRCPKCGKNSRISSWTFVQKSFYVVPYGCTQGDYWKKNEVETCDIVCPSGELTYIYNAKLKDRLISLLSHNPFEKKEIFGKVINRECR